MLIDDILRCSELHQERNNLAEGLIIAVRFQVDNVARYLHEEIRNQKDRRYKIQEQIPNIAPIAPVMWFEYGGTSVEKPTSEKYGCMLSIDYDEVNGIRAKKWEGVDVPENVRWILRAEYWGHYLEYGLQAIANCDWVYYLFVDENGQCLGIHSMENFRRGSSTPKDYKPDEGQRERLHEEVLVSLLTICFSHCKGTEIKKHQPSRQVRRATERARKPLFYFHTIDIQPSIHVLHTEGRISKNGLAKALHICRGHFAHYTSEHPLFGKYTGTFYRPMHVRGKSEQGQVIKDYRIGSQS